MPVKTRARGFEPVRSWSDWIFSLSVMLGLVWPPVLMGTLVAALLRKPPVILRWEHHHTTLLIAAILGGFVILVRGVNDSTDLVLRYAFLWGWPFIILLYRPSTETLSLFSRFVFAYLLVDLVFNVGGTLLGRDLLGREIDLREDVLFWRMGGVFAHSYYSGTFSIVALMAILTGRYSKAWAVLPAINLMLAGAWRLSAALALILIFFVWRRRTYRQEMMAVVLLSLLSVFATVYTSGLMTTGEGYVNPANSFRVYAWTTAIEKIAVSPLTGAGYPREKGIDGMTTNVVDDSLIAESWYLGSAITFGIPYALMRLAGIVLLFYSRRRSVFSQVFGPVVLIDMVYGGFLIDGTLSFIMICLQLSTEIPETARPLNFITRSIGQQGGLSGSGSFAENMKNK